MLGTLDDDALDDARDDGDGDGADGAARGRADATVRAMDGGKRARAPARGGTSTSERGKRAKANGGGAAVGKERAATRRHGRANARLRWTPELHRDFVNAVAQLGGLELATPTGIMRLMNTNGMTAQHIKSHLQKYRLQEGAGGSRGGELDPDAGRERRAMIKRARAQQQAEMKQRTSEADLTSLDVAALPGARPATTDSLSSDLPSTPVTTALLSELMNKTSAVNAETPGSGGKIHSLDAILAQALKPASALSEEAAAAANLAAVPAAVPAAVSENLIQDMPHVGHALLKQLDMQKQLHDQLIAQRRLQTAIEEHGKYLASILAQEVSGKTKPEGADDDTADDA